jgi:hypothetical protein
MRIHQISPAVVGLSLLLPVGGALAQETAGFAAKPTWAPPTAAAVESQLQAYFRAARIPPDRQVTARALWSASANAGASDLLDRLANCLAATDTRVAQVVALCAASPAAVGVKMPDFAWLSDSETPALVRHNIRLYLARWLVQAGMYDEALTWMDGLAPADVVQPAALLFYRAVAHQRLVQPDPASAAVEQLITRRDELPLRYQKLAELMQQDLAALQDDSLDHIARRMEDVRRRLAMGRAGQRVQSIENGVVESLDKMIKQIEDSMSPQPGPGGASPQGGSQQGQTPMQDSRIAQIRAPGDVEQRDIGDRAGWGNLPEKDREKALQDIGREFPSHYREVIEEYFRRLAAEESRDR